MSGVFSIVSHCTLQYFPAGAAHEQFGCAHFFGFSVAIRLSFVQFQRAFDLDLFSRKRYENSPFPSVQNDALRAETFAAGRRFYSWVPVREELADGWRNQS